MNGGDMKKRLLISLGISFVICCIGCLYNYLSFRERHYFPLAIHSWGGECMLESGFGMWAFHTYAMEEGQSGTINLRFSILNFLLYLVVITLIIWLLISVFNFIRNKVRKQ